MTRDSKAGKPRRGKSSRKSWDTSTGHQVPATGKKGQEARDEAAVRVAHLHDPKQR